MMSTQILEKITQIEKELLTLKLSLLLSKKNMLSEKSGTYSQDSILSEITKVRRKKWNDLYASKI